MVKLEENQKFRVKLKKITTKDLSVKGIELRGPNWLKSGVKLKKIKSLMVNWRSICINPRPKIKMKKVLEFEADIEVRQGQNCIKLKIHGQLGVQCKEIKS